MSDSDSGGKAMKYHKKEDVYEKRKRRKRSNSVNSIDFERIKKKKSKNVYNSGDDSDDDKQVNKNKKKSKNVYNSGCDSDDDKQVNKNKKKKPKNKYLEEISDTENNMKNEVELKKGKRKEKRRSKSRSVEKIYEKKNGKSMKNEAKNKKGFMTNNDSLDEGGDKSTLNQNRKGKTNTEVRDDRKLSSTNMQNKYSSYKNRKDKKYTKADEEVGHNSSRYQYDENDDKSKRSRREKTKESGRSSRKHNDNKSQEKSSRKSPSPDEDEKNSSSVERPFRHYNFSRGPVRKNSDSYWNKYSDRLKEPDEHNVEVGPRYYGAKDGGSSDTDKSKQVDTAETGKEPDKEEAQKEQRQKKTLDLLTSKTGGAYIPPARLRMMQESITDKSSPAYQRLAWEALKKSIQGHVNKVNTSNIRAILHALQKENIIRGKGLLCRSLIQAQAASPTFTNVYAAFVAVLNAKFPKIGELLLKRLVVQFRRGFRRNDKTICITAATFIAHLVNQEVAHEIVALEILTMLIETPTDDSVEVAIAFLKECGMKLTEVSSKGVMAIFDMLRNILHEGNLEKRVQYMIEVMFQIRKEDFKAHPSVVKELDLVEEYDRIQHMITLEENHDPQDILNVFKLDPDYEANEAKYKSLVEEESDTEGSGGGSSGSDDSDNDSNEENENEEKGENGVIIDRTETNLIALRKTIYLTIQSSLDFEECAHKLMRMELKPGQEKEMVHMFIDCCAEQRTYEKFFGLLSQRFCQINRNYIQPFQETFQESYETIHRMTNDKLRNVAKLFAHLLFTDAISWDVLASIRLNEDDTTSSSRIFIKILFLELSEYMGLAKLNQRVKDPNLQNALAGLFPRDNPKHTRFAINFFTSIGLGGLTDELREHLKSQPKQSLILPQLVEDLSSSSDSSSSDSSESSSSDSSSSDSEDAKSAKRKKKNSQLKKKINESKSSKEKEKRPSKKLEKSKAVSRKKYSSPSRKRDR